MLFVNVNNKDINLISKLTKIELIIKVWNIEITPS